MASLSADRRRGLLLILPALLLTLALAAAACGGGGEGGSETPTDGGQPPSGGGATKAEIKMVPTLKFDKTALTIAAKKDVSVTANNTDSGQLHNFAVYKSKGDATSGEDSLAATEICSAPCKNDLTLNLDAGEYFFRCDVHPTEMTGKLTAE